jgi:long-subunit acyl-CoA synthetase (AMP-forming)
MLTNRPEAHLIDTAAMCLGAVPFSLYNTSSPEQLQYLLSHSEAAITFTEAQFAQRLCGVSAAPAQVIVVDAHVPATRTLTAFEAGGDPGFDLAGAARSVGPGDLATLIYTSGTTGPPKGVELTHANLTAEWRLIDQVIPLRAGGRFMSYLPMAHLADRVAGHYVSLVTGGSVTCVADPRQAVAALPEVRPTIWMAVPRIWEKLRAALMPALQTAGHAVAPEALAAQLRERIGLDRAELLLSGAAPIAPEVLQFFADLGLDIYEVWGMTETTAAATLSPRGEHRVGTVGQALPGVEIRLAADGELLVRGPIVTRGYRDDPQRTAEALDADGWMHTGDIGTIDADGYVTIVDRKKELIITAAGKNISPANIENAVKAACAQVGAVVAIGDRRPYVAALLVLDADVEPTDAVREAVAAGVERANERLSRAEQIKRYKLLDHPWQPGGEELTPTMKLRRKPIAEKYAAVIDAMYA